MDLVKFFSIDKIFKAYAIVRHNGGVWRSLRMLYRIDTLKKGRLVGTDEFGNRYFENPGYFYGRDRWVIYSNKVWLDYDASQIPPEWHLWMHHTTETPPSEKPPIRRDWMMTHEENHSGTPEKYIPYSTTRTKVLGWEPNQQKPVST
ncbi:unnamed protein product [Soboliphyme baturini]|uniref:NADH dehydrogenase [ubiquinone] 1 alpha subcomplex subunit 12 n=1 Tax=Soboliphyme baturini TaxID=241478 RepID=A0A183I8U8_9BILA|nr:unnamed protein product [Soboliphyme baturini]